MREEATEEKKTMTLDDAVELAKQEPKKSGVYVEKMDVTADEENTAWERFVAIQPSVLEGEIIEGMSLEEKDYWAVYCGPKANVLGGDAWVFVDKETAKVIGVIRGR